jgi:hypothetical protein
MEETSQKKFKAANGEELKIKGKYLFDLKVQGETIQHPFYVISSLNEKAIIGMDFIRTHKLSFCPVSEEFMWSGKSD